MLMKELILLSRLFRANEMNPEAQQANQIKIYLNQNIQILKESLRQEKLCIVVNKEIFKFPLSVKI